MAKTEVILTHNIVGLGGESDHVKVAAGYARNYLFPQGLAIPLSAANKRRIEALQKRRAEREAHEFNTMTELSKSISKLIAIVAVKTGDDGKMFGTVTAGMIADQLKTQFDIALDKRKIHLEHPIKALGEYDLDLRLHQEVHATLKVRVESSTPLVQSEAEKEAAEHKEKEAARRSESRGHRRAREGASTAPAEGKAEAKAEGEEKPKKARAPKAKAEKKSE
jgi:large subunit ribosomal protein L9